MIIKNEYINVSKIQPLIKPERMSNATNNPKLKNNPINKKPTEPGRNGKPIVPKITNTAAAAIDHTNSVLPHAS